VNAFLSPLRDKRNDYATRIDDVQDILRTGADKARIIAAKTFANVRNAVGF